MSGQPFGQRKAQRTKLRAVERLRRRSSFAAERHRCFALCSLSFARERSEMQPKILVPVDDSPEARKAVTQAVELAGRLGAGLTVMTVIATPMLPRQLMDPAQVAQLEAHFRQSGEQVLDQLRTVADAAGVPVETRLVEGIPADEILAEAGKGYLFIVMGSRGAGLAGRDRALLGSVSDRVLRQAPVPVLVIRDEE
jgi:nucleotide-binding universal stress UspA family protein